MVHPYQLDENRLLSEISSAILISSVESRHRMPWWIGGKGSWMICGSMLVNSWTSIIALSAPGEEKGSEELARYGSHGQGSRISYLTGKEGSECTMSILVTWATATTQSLTIFGWH